MSHSWWVLVVNALAVYRLTRLFTTDTITLMLREGEVSVAGWVIKPGVFLHCDWCLSVWFGGGAIALTELTFWWQYVAAGLALSTIAGLISERT